MRMLYFSCILLAFVGCSQARSRPAVDICDRKPTITGLCVSSTLGIYYDAETQRCRYLGCSPDKKLFASLEDCDKICNSRRRRERRARNSKHSAFETE